ncbi:hypothetical protein CAOG_002722 [Capsaspora owczarzaki ATCC 30864]|uniref:PWWP domain-containing protein n=1 Tax=Capsaspora owczarzaki (strain ATCC 30864) TaxID=595528 RepID=A0A0D2X1Y2_CAPO3|nr:hypothetical protein CAOG_002722 [Capsaspora owczarzaki ATCC 30864]
MVRMMMLIFSQVEHPLVNATALAGKSPKATNSAPVRSKAPGTSNQPEPAKASQTLLAARSSSGSSFPSTLFVSLHVRIVSGSKATAKNCKPGAVYTYTSAEEQRALRSRPPLVLSKSMFDTPVQASKSKAKIEVIDTPTTLEPDQSKPKVAAIDFAQSPRTSQASGRSTVHRDVIEPNSLEEEDKPAVRQLRQRTIASPNAKSPASPNPRAKSASSPTLAISKRRASEMDAEGPGPSLRVSAADVTDVVSSQEEPRSRRALASSQSPGDDSQGSRQRGLFNSAADGTEIRKLRQRVASPETKSSHARVASNRGAGGASKRYTSESDADAANISARASVANVASSSQEDSSFNSAKVNKPGRQSQAQVSLSRNGELPVVPDDSAESPSGKRSTRANPGPVAAPQPSSTAGKKQHQTSKPTQQPKLDTFFSSAAAKPLPTSVKGRTASKEHTDAANNPDKSPKTKLEVFDFDEQPSRATHAHRPTNTSIPRPSVVRSIAADFLEPDSTPAAVAAASASVLRSIALSAQETVSTTAAAAAAAAAAGPSDKALPPARKVLRLDPHVEPSSSPPSSSGDSAAFETRLRSGVVRQQFDDEDEDGDLPSSSGPVDDDSDDELPAVQLSHQSTTDFRPGTVVWAKRRLDLMLNRFIWWPAKYISRLKAQKLHECNLFTGNLSLTDKPLEKRAKFISVKPYKCTDPDDPDTPAAYREALARARKAAEKLAVGTASIDQSSPMKQRFFAKAASDDEDDPMDTDQQAEELSDDDDNNGNTVQPSAADARDSSDEEQDAILAIRQAVEAP